MHQQHCKVIKVWAFETKQKSSQNEITICLWRVVKILYYFLFFIQAYIHLLDAIESDKEHECTSLDCGQNEDSDHPVVMKNQNKFDPN